MQASPDKIDVPTSGVGGGGEEASRLSLAPPLPRPPDAAIGGPAGTLFRRSRPCRRGGGHSWHLGQARTHTHKVKLAPATQPLKFDTYLIRAMESQ